MTIALGFTGLADVFSRRVSDVGVDVIRQAVDVSTEAYSRAFDQMISVLVEDVKPGVVTERYKLPVTGTMQPLDEWGRPKPALGETYYTQSWPLEMGGFAWGGNWVALAKMTVQEANDNMMQAIRADADWNIRRMLGALLYDTAWTFPAQENFDALTVYPLALSSETTTLFANRQGSLVAGNGYGAQASAIDANNNPFPTIKTYLDKFVANSGPVVSYIHNDQRASIEALSGFVEVHDGDITPGSGSDVLSAQLAGHLGDEVCGKVNGVWIVEWSRIPTGYIVSHKHGTKVLARRQQDIPALRGLIKREITEGNLTTYEFYRHAGYAPRNRVAAHVQYIGGASYTPPTGYTLLPLAI